MILRVYKNTGVESFNTDDKTLTEIKNYGFPITQWLFWEKLKLTLDADQPRLMTISENIRECFYLWLQDGMFTEARACIDNSISIGDLTAADGALVKDLLPS